MRSLVHLFLAIALVLVTTALPRSQTAEARVVAWGSAATVADISAKEGSAQEQAGGFVKRCQNGSGALSCPFFKPAVLDSLPRLETRLCAIVPPFEAALRSRATPTPHRPPKTLSV